MEHTFALIDRYVVHITSDECTLYGGTIYKQGMSEENIVRGKYEEMRFIDEESALRYFIYLIKYEKEFNF